MAAQPERRALLRTAKRIGPVLRRDHGGQDFLEKSGLPASTLETDRRCCSNVTDTLKEFTSPEHAMSLFEKSAASSSTLVEWLDDSRDTMVFRFPRHQNEIKDGGQAGGSRDAKRRP